MISRWMRAALVLLAMAPAAAPAFESVDTIPWPSMGRFPAYKADPGHWWSLFVQGGVMYDDNVLRTPGNEQADTIARVGTGIRSEGRIYGRQRLLLEAIAEYYDFQKFNVLDHFAHGILGEWQWELGNDLSGALGYRRRHRLADLGETQRPVRDLVTEERFYVTAAYRFMPDWRVTGGADYGQVEHSARAVAKAETTSVYAGLEYVTPAGNAIGLVYRRSHGDAPISEERGLGAFPDNEFESTELAATLSYRFGAQLRAGARVGRTTREYTDLPGRDFSGTTYRGELEWIPEPKLTFVLEAYREPAAVVDVDALHVVRRGFAVGPNWAPTYKLVFYARWIRERRVFQGDAGIDITGATLRDETFQLVRFGAGWEPRRRWHIGAGFDHGRRESNALGRDYTYNAAMLNVRWTY